MEGGAPKVSPQGVVSVAISEEYRSCTYASIYIQPIRIYPYLCSTALCLPLCDLFIRRLNYLCLSRPAWGLSV